LQKENQKDCSETAEISVRAEKRAGGQKEYRRPRFLEGHSVQNISV